MAVPTGALTGAPIKDLLTLRTPHLPTLPRDPRTQVDPEPTIAAADGAQTAVSTPTSASKRQLYGCVDSLRLWRVQRKAWVQFNGAYNKERPLMAFEGIRENKNYKSGGRVPQSREKASRSLEMRNGRGMTLGILVWVGRL